MEKQMTQLNIPVPPVPILEQAVGYRNERHARFLALWWEPCGDEAMVSDGFVTFTGHWPGYLAYVQHRAVHPQLAAYNLGSSEESAEYHLIIDLQKRQAYIAPWKKAESILASQGQGATAQEKPVILSSEDLEKLVEGLMQQLHPVPTMDELMCQMEEDRECVLMLRQWLDEQVQ
jgi:hypothetical protein